MRTSFFDTHFNLKLELFLLISILFLKDSLILKIVVKCHCLQSAKVNLILYLCKVVELPLSAPWDQRMLIMLVMHLHIPGGPLDYYRRGYLIWVLWSTGKSALVHSNSL